MQIYVEFNLTDFNVYFKLSNKFKLCYKNVKPFLKWFLKFSG